MATGSSLSEELKPFSVTPINAGMAVSTPATEGESVDFSST